MRDGENLSLFVGRRERFSSASLHDSLQVQPRGDGIDDY